MQVKQLTTAAELDAIQDDWNKLAGVHPFRRYEWLGTWWRHYVAAADHQAAAGEPFVLAVYDPGDGGTLVGLAPWYLERSWTGGRTLRFLGDGIACSEYPTILCRAGRQSSVTAALAQWLDQQSPQIWDTIHLCACDHRDEAVQQLASHLEARGHQAHRAAGDACWRIELPSTWDEFVSRLSTTNRKRGKRARKLVESLQNSNHLRFGTAGADDVMDVMETMIQLHQRRRASRQETGCFDSPRFCRFFRETTSRLFTAGLLQLHYIQLDGRMVVVDYFLSGDRTLYVYQSGLDPDALQYEPGRLLSLETIRLAIEGGLAAVDYLRGDEAYKAHLRATPYETLDVRIIRATPTARLRHVAWLARRRARGWAKQNLATARRWQTAAATSLLHTWSAATSKRGQAGH